MAIRCVAALIALALATIAFDSPASPFDNVSDRSGIRFVLRNGATPERHQIETMAGGVAVFDFDNDGYPDIYFANGAPQPSLAKPDAAYWNRRFASVSCRSPSCSCCKLSGARRR